MFTISQIKEAHSKVKSGADFPAYVQELIQLGVRSYDHFVSDGHTEFSGTNAYKTQSDAKYTALEIAYAADEEKLKKELKFHQQGGTDYLTFCRLAAEAGVEKWRVDMEEMTCTYYDRKGNKMLVETIPVS